MLQDKAMLCNLRLSCWTGEKSDSMLGREVSSRKKAENGSVTAVVRMIPQHHLKPIRAIDAKIRAAHHHHTLPWLDDGARILPTAAFFDHSNAISGLLQEREVAVETFLRHYPTIREDARIHLGELYTDDMWPHSVRARFTAQVAHLPIPDGSDFRVNMEPSELERLREGVEQAVRGQVHQAMGSVRLRIHNVLSNFVDRIKDYETVNTPEGEKVVGIFRNSVMDNVASLADILPKLNLTDDPEVAEAAREIKANITAHSVDALRDSDDLRRTVMEEANKLLSKFGKKA